MFGIDLVSFKFSNGTIKWYYKRMNRKQRKTFEAIFSEPIRRNIVWTDIVSLIQGLGGTVLQGNGSRVRFDLNGVSLNILILPILKKN
jgi:hypothetical protein